MDKSAVERPGLNSGALRGIGGTRGTAANIVGGIKAAPM